VSPHLATITGVAYDSIGRAPLGGAQVQFAAAGNASARIFSALADSLGRFRIDSVPYGDYLAGFFHPAIDSLGIEVQPRAVRVAMERQHVNLGSPPPAQLLSAICGDRLKSDSTALVIGHVRQADTEQPIVNASVILEWTETTIGARGAQTVNRSATAHSRDGGWFALCGVPSGFEYTMHAAFGEDTTGFIEHESAPNGADHVTFFVGHAVREIVAAGPAFDSVARNSVSRLRGDARLVGRVVNKLGAPVAGAKIEIVGAAVVGTATSEGRFSIDSLPSGTRTLNVRAIGYAPVGTVVQLASGRPTNAELHLDERATQLEAVEIKSTTAYSRKLVVFENHRRKSVSGMFVRPSAENGSDQWTLVTIFQQAPNTRVDDSQGEPIATLRASNGRPGRCIPSLYVDGERTYLTFADLNGYYGPGEFARGRSLLQQRRPAGGVRRSPQRWLRSRCNLDAAVQEKDVAPSLALLETRAALPF
jgi:hypothetical protein